MIRLYMLLATMLLAWAGQAQPSEALFDEILPLEPLPTERDLFAESYSTGSFTFQNGKTLDFYFADEAEALQQLSEAFPTPAVILGRQRFDNLLRLLDNYENRIAEFGNLDESQLTQIDKLSQIQEEMAQTDSLRLMQLRNYEEGLSSLQSEVDQMGALLEESNEIARKLDRRRIWNYIIGGLAGIAVGILVLD